MAVDRSKFLLIAGALAAGGAAGVAGGWATRAQPARAPLVVSPELAPLAKTVAVPAEPVKVEIVEPASASAACDDNVGTAADCPSVGPSDEGLCADVIFKRCGEFKAAFKPRIAEKSVACLRQLKGSERCDPLRINLCGHTALMKACPEPAPASKGTFQAATATVPASVILTQEPAAPPSALVSACDGLVKSCAEQALAPTANDCRQTLAGMNDVGRASAVECVTAHCADRGLFGCEAVPRATIVAVR